MTSRRDDEWVGKILAERVDIVHGDIQIRVAEADEQRTI